MVEAKDRQQHEICNPLQRVIEITHERLVVNGWKLCTCSSCQQPYYCKAKAPIEFCGSFKCAKGYVFLEKPRRRSNVGLDDICSSLKSVFTEHGFHHHEPVDISNCIGSTIYIGNAGQIFDRQIFREEPVSCTPALVLQPSIRLQRHGRIGKPDGFTTSFVNISSEQLDVDPFRHIQTVDLWMDFLSKIGLYMGDFTLKPEIEEASWGSRSGIKTHTLRFNYGGLEIGVCNYTIIPQNTRLAITQSDISFGLERVAWAINKNTRFYEIIGPLNNALRGEDERMDAYRTTTLMASSGVRPGTNEQGSKLRSLARIYGSFEMDFNPELVRYYYNWWSKYIKPSLDLTSTEQILRWETYRTQKIMIREALRNNERLSARLGNEFPRVDKFTSNLSSGEIDILRRELFNK